MTTENVRLTLNKEAFWLAEPFPHLVLDGFFEKEKVVAAEKSFPKKINLSWTPYIHFNELKYGFSHATSLPLPVKSLIDYFHSQDFCRQLSELMGTLLFPDPQLVGGGLHQTFPNGFLNIHTDFSHHPHRRNWKRRLNLILYLNDNWKDSYGGNLELWNKTEETCTQSISPISNRVVIFLADPNAWHGSPQRLTCPKNESRKSIALYYYEEVNGESNHVQPTQYYSTSNSQLVRWFTRVENWMLKIFSLVRYVGRGNNN